MEKLITIIQSRLQKANLPALSEEQVYAIKLGNSDDMRSACEHYIYTIDSAREEARSWRLSESHGR